MAEEVKVTVYPSPSSLCIHIYIYYIHIHIYILSQRVTQGVWVRRGSDGRDSRG